MSFAKPYKLRMALTILLAGFPVGAGCGAGDVDAASQPAKTRLETVLRQMDDASAKFQSAQADFVKAEYDRIVHDTTTETGKIYFLRKNGAMQMGAKSANLVVEYKDGKVRLFHPALNHVDEYSATGKNQSMAQTFLTLGFGGSGKDLARAWTITDQGPQQMSDGGKGVEVEQLDLVSKDAAVKANYPHIAIWIDPVRDVALKQIFYETSGDTNTATYSNIVLNQKIDLSAFAIKCKGACG